MYEYISSLPISIPHREVSLSSSLKYLSILSVWNSSANFKCSKELQLLNAQKPILMTPIANMEVRLGQLEKTYSGSFDI